jgi:L-amino acid N-acyltransferase YncA
MTLPIFYLYVVAEHYSEKVKTSAIYAACGPFPNYSTLAEEVFALSD